MCWWANQQSHLNKTTALLFIFSLPNEFRTKHDIIVSIRSTFTLCSICIDKWRALLTYFSRSRSVRPFSWYCQFRLRFISVCLALSLTHIFSYIWMCYPSFHSITWFDYTRASERTNEFVIFSPFDSDWIQLSGTVTVACFFRFKFRHYHDIYGLTKYIVFARSLTWFSSNRRLKNVPNIRNNVANVCRCVCANNVVSLHENRNCTHFNNGSNWWECVWHISSDDIVTIFIVFLINKFAYFPCDGHSLAKLSITVSS